MGVNRSGCTKQTSEENKRVKGGGEIKRFFRDNGGFRGAFLKILRSKVIFEMEACPLLLTTGGKHYLGPTLFFT